MRPLSDVIAPAREWQDGHAASITVALLSRGSAADNLSARDTFGLRHIGLQTERETDIGYGVVGTPSAILVGADGRVLRPLVAGADRIGELAELELRSSALERRNALPSEPAPAERLGESRPIDVHPPAAPAAARRAGTERRSVLGAATGAAVVAGVTASVVAPTAAADGNQRAAAARIAGELGDLILKIAPETFAAGQALRGARINAPGKPIPVPAAAQAAWHRRLLDIDRAHANVSGVSGAAASRAAALHALEVLRAVCRSGQLAITSPTAAKQSRYAKQQAAEERRLRAAVESLTVSLRQAGATHL